MLLRNDADVTHCEKTVFYFQNKAVYQTELQANRSMFKNDFYLMKVQKNLKFLILVFFWCHMKTKNTTLWITRQSNSSQQNIVEAL